jgi:Uma2 family endonuclease
MSAAKPLPKPDPPAGPRPVIWTVTEFHNMKEHGILRGQWTHLINGRIYEEHHGDPIAPGPRFIRWTREQYYRLGELGFFRNRRVQLLRGEIIEMSPQGWRHFTAITVAARALETAFGPGFFVRQQGPLALGSEEPEPDVAVVPGTPHDYTAHPTTALLIVEVSDTTLDYDVTTKAELYATAGIADYWVLDVDGRRLLVFRDPAPIPDGGAAYRTHLALGPADSVAPLAAPASTVRVADLLP